jgi:hypothetical protein
MPTEYPIADMYVFPLKRQAGRVSLLRENDHLLRRFGELELIDLASGEVTAFTSRAEADRFLFPISGEFSANLVDLRVNSPSRGRRNEILVRADEPLGILIPWGVACSLSSNVGARLIVLSTHSKPHSDDFSVQQDELSSYIAPQ